MTSPDPPVTRDARACCSDWLKLARYRQVVRPITCQVFVKRSCLQQTVSSDNICLTNIWTVVILTSVSAADLLTAAPPSGRRSHSPPAGK